MHTVLGLYHERGLFRAFANLTNQPSDLTLRVITSDGINRVNGGLLGDFEDGLTVIGLMHNAQGVGPWREETSLKTHRQIASVVTSSNRQFTFLQPLKGNN